MHAGTIVASNYSAMARVLGESFLDHHPDSTFHVLVVDDEPVDFGERISVARLSDLDLGDVVLNVMKTIYDVMEFSTSVKPSFLRLLLGSDDAAVACYLDPDIVVYSSFDDAVAPAVDCGVVLTPHVLEPIPRDGLKVSEGTIMQSGMYNCGFLAVGRVGMEFLDWWDERLRFDAVVDFEQSHFTDQRWVDWVPSLFSYSICRDPGMNVAWWNIHDRPVDASVEPPTTHGVPIRFAHFSGYDPRTPDLLSKHQVPSPRIAHTVGTGMRELTDRYSESLAAFGHIERRQLPYPWNTAVDSSELTVDVRRRIRSAILAELEDGTVTLHNRQTPDGFGGGACALSDWLAPPPAPDHEPVPVVEVTQSAPSRASAAVQRSKHFVRRAQSAADRVAATAQQQKRRRPEAGGASPIAFLHVPKSAGSSVISSLRTALDDRRWSDYSYDPAWMGPYRTAERPPSLAHQVLENPADLADVDVVAGHFKLATLLTRFELGQVCTVLREPRARLLSHYEYWRGLSPEAQAAELPWQSSRSARELDFADWLLDESIAYQTDNTLIRQLVDDPAIPDNQFIANGDLARLARQAVRTLRRFGFVGLVEQGDVVFDGLGTFVGASLERERINVTPPVNHLDVDPRGLFDRCIPGLAARTAGDAIVWKAAAQMVGVRDADVVAESSWMRRVWATLEQATGREPNTP